MVKISHYLGGILLIMGTTIGAGMLGIPIGTGFSGFFPALLVIGACWLVMLFSAYCFLDVNLSIEGESNFITMCERTLGMWGKVLCWISYLLLLYSLTAAYIASSAPLFQGALKDVGIVIPLQLAYFILPVVFGGFIYLGTLGVDVVNRVLMVGLAASYVVLASSLPSHVDVKMLEHVDFGPLLIGVLLVITSFGYHIIIPSLTTYMYHDRKHLRRTIFLGSIAPLIVYVVWEALFLGIVPIEGPYSLSFAWETGTDVSTVLLHLISNPIVMWSIQLFAFFAILTSFLGVSLSLSDFLMDGLKLKEGWKGRLLAIMLTFVPPILFLFAYKRGFILALQHAGAIVGVLLIFLPAAMAWTLKGSKFYQSVLGKTLLIIMMAIAFFLVGLDVAFVGGKLNHLLEKYVSVEK